MMEAARSPNQIMALYARKKLSSPEPEPVAAQSIPPGPEAAPIRSYSTHPTYPFPIADLPVTSAVLRSGIVPASAGKVMKKGDLDLVYFQPFVKAATASMLYKHLLDELPWYKVCLHWFGV